MSGLKTHHLVCDGCGSVFKPDGPPPCLWEVRREADACGWTFIIAKQAESEPAKSLDFCASCEPTDVTKRWRRRLSPIGKLLRAARLAHRCLQAEGPDRPAAKALEEALGHWGGVKDD